MTDRAYSGDAPLRRKRNLRIAALIVLAVALFVAVLWFSVSALTRPVVEAGDGFMGALEQGDFPRAYAMTAPDLQRELGSAERSWTSRSIRNGTGRVSGPYTSLEGRPSRAELVMTRVDGAWRITGFRLSPE
jgi:hypothetical protein